MYLVAMALAMASPDRVIEECRPQSRGLRIGSWNLSGWLSERAAAIATDVQADILAVQETHLAALPLEWAHHKSPRPPSPSWSPCPPPRIICPW